MSVQPNSSRPPSNGPPGRTGPDGSSGHAASSSSPGRLVAKRTSAAKAFPKALREPLRERRADALEAFFDVFFSPIYGYVQKLVSDVALAEDLTQEVFVQIQQKAASYDAARDPKPWVFAIAANLVRSHWRYSGVRETKSVEDLHGEDVSNEVVSSSPTPIESLGDEEVRERVARAVLALSGETREVVLLRAYEGLSFEDLAQTLAISEVAARKRYSRALAKLREELGVSEPGGAS